HALVLFGTDDDDPASVGRHEDAVVALNAPQGERPRFTDGRRKEHQLRPFLSEGVRQRPLPIRREVAGVAVSEPQGWASVGRTEIDGAGLSTSIALFLEEHGPPVAREGGQPGLVEPGQVALSLAIRRAEENLADVDLALDEDRSVFGDVVDGLEVGRGCDLAA